MAPLNIGTRDDLDRIFDRNLETEVVRIMPGEYFVSKESEVITTVLGSCVSACIRDTRQGIGGMNHFMLPDADMGGNTDPAAAGRYGTHAMQFLLDAILKLGGNVDNLEVKLFGGGKIVEGMSDVGERNIEFVRGYLANAGISVHAEDLGLTFPRKINYFVDSGRVMVKKLRALHNRSVVATEKDYFQGIDGHDASAGNGS
jgi:chemotaxis protein CheD